MMNRNDGRFFDQTRNIKIIKSPQEFSMGACIIEVGRTIVHCSASIENETPKFIDPLKSGWLTCEYAMLPSSTPTRVPREASKGKQQGRTIEIQRLIGRSIRAIVELEKFPGKTVWIDCDVLQADGGTRTASISGASVALNMAFKKLHAKGEIQEMPQIEHVAAISLGIVKGNIMLDLNYLEDSSADVDMNLVMTESGRFVETQISSEGNVYSEDDMYKLIELGKKGIKRIVDAQKEFIASFQV
ncbi:MAG: hypothetical protein ACD_79C00414G0001 [uncultured bacterium]|nr:MAG: hypothetical protein ACD_79C00414G0001 [uncultured bacterium]